MSDIDGTFADYMAWHCGDTYLTDTAPMKQWHAIWRTIRDSELSIAMIRDEANGYLLGFTVMKALDMSEEDTCPANHGPEDKCNEPCF